MRAPPRTPLASSCAFGELSSAESGLYFCSHDVADCFYNFRIPTGLSQYLGLRPLRAGDVGVTHIRGIPVGPAAIITPRITVLPMVLASLYIGLSRHM